MTDIVKSLRSIRGKFLSPIEAPPIFQWVEDAADEIERLRKFKMAALEAYEPGCDCETCKLVRSDITVVECGQALSAQEHE